MNAEPMSETKVCDKPAMRDLAEGVLALLGDDCFLVLNERNNENSRLKMKQSIAHAMTKGNVCHDGMKGIFVQPHCDDAKECLFLRFVGEPYVIDIDSSRRAIVCKVRASGHTVETSKDNTQSFEARAKWCNEAIIQLATGGLLTVTTQSGSGTLAGGAHSDSFSRLCAASARSISAAINRQFLRPALQEAFPHSPMLVSFELAPEPVDDRLQLAQLLGAVNSAGFRPSAETVSEMMNFEVQPVQEAGPGQPPVVNGRGLPGFVGTEFRSVYAEARPSETPGLGGVVANASNDLTQDDIAEAEPPLNDGELAALRALGGELNPDQIAADADYMTREMLAGLREPITNRGEGGHECKATKRACPLAAVENLAESCKQGYVRPARHESEKARREYQAEVEQAAVAGKLSVTSKATGQPLAFTGKTVEHLRLQEGSEFNKRMNNVGNFLATAYDPDYVLEHKNGKELERVYLRTMTNNDDKKRGRDREHYYCVVEKVTGMPGQMLTAYEVDDYGRYAKKIKPREIKYRRPQK